MKRLAIALISSLLAAIICLGYGGYKALTLLDGQSALRRAQAAEKAEYEAAQKTVSLDAGTDRAWTAPVFSWPETPSAPFAAPPGFVEKRRFSTPAGFPIVTDMDGWQDRDLESVYNELIQIKHGSEISKLDAIFLCSDTIPFQEDANGQFVRNRHAVKLRFRLPGLLAGQSAFDWSAASNAIWIHVPQGDGANRIAYLLSHEYGHFFHSVYNAGRDASIERTFTPDQAERLGSSYIWQREEIEANDFATLMGSPGCFEKTALPDVKQELAQRVAFGWEDAGSYKRVYGQIFQLLNPLAYTELPPAGQVEGLAASYYALLDEPPAAPAVPRILPTLSISGKNGAYTVRWTRPWRDAEVFYTLLCTADSVDPALTGTVFEGNKQHVFVCSRRGNEENTAAIGKARLEQGNTIYTLDDGLAVGIKTFRLFTVLPDNTVYVSEPLIHDFGNGGTP